MVRVQYKDLVSKFNCSVCFIVRESNPRVNEVMELWGIERRFDKLLGFFIDRVSNMAMSLPGKQGVIAWQEVFDDIEAIPQNLIIQVWKGWGFGGWQREVERAS